MDMMGVIVVGAVLALLTWIGWHGGEASANRTWQAEIVSRGYGEWVPSKEDPTRNVFAWKENKKEDKVK